MMAVVALFPIAVMATAAILVVAIAIIATAIASVVMMMAAAPMGTGDDFEVRPFCVEDRLGEVFRSTFV